MLQIKLKLLHQDLLLFLKLLLFIGLHKDLQFLQVLVCQLFHHQKVKKKIEKFYIFVTYPFFEIDLSGANDGFIPQLISSATTHVNEMVKRKIADPNRIAVAGHSYGAFMTAHLLAHTNLFCAGIGSYFGNFLHLVFNNLLKFSKVWRL